jgi:hypothetical protein
MMNAVMKRETVQALLDQIPDDQLEPIAQFLACRAADGTDLRWQAILTRGGGRDLTPQEWEAFLAEHGPRMLPPDGEG